MADREDDSEEDEEEIEENIVAVPENSGARKKCKQVVWKKKRFQGKPCPKIFNPEQITNPPTVRTPIEYFEDYFKDDFFESAAVYTNMYSVLKNGISMDTNKEELQRVFGINLIMGCIRYPRLRLYWQKQYSFSAIVQCMPRDRFLNLRNCFHLVDTASKTPQVNNKLWKVQPIINQVRNVCLNLPRDQRSFSIDEQMIPFLGRAPVKQYVKNKPRPVGLKNFVLTASCGLVLDFIVYQGETTNFVHKELGLGPAVVLTLVRTLPVDSFVYFDRYFNTIPLLEELKKQKIEGTGTIQTNRVKGIPFVKSTALKKGESISLVYKGSPSLA
ncbi:piggyBac transposable element-derived protein 3 [Parasteatoda tepidariorum]|uniref:piggyBac transposable element-derived protein 3 n=1 Tax=Parasteatoda tepidariorum TaxID=114398 RepID=UPI0039BD7390